MRARLASVALALAALVAAVGAVPAFTADNGTIVGTVTAGAPPAPCIQLSTTTFDYGTLAFRRNWRFRSRPTGLHPDELQRR